MANPMYLMEMDARRFLFHILVGTAATLMIFLASLKVPFVGVVMIIFTPLPVMVLCHLWGLRGGLLVVLIGSVVISTLSNPLLGIIFVTEFGLVGILLHHYVARKGMAWDRGVFFSSLIVVSVMALLVALLKTATSSSGVDWMGGEIHETGRSVLQLYSMENMKDQPQWIDSERILTLVLRISPALMVLTIWLEGIINVFLFGRITSRLSSRNGQVIIRPEFSSWICPDRLVWVGILGGFLIVTRVSPLVTIGLNIVILLLAVYFGQGIAVISFFFKKKNVPLGFRVIAYALIGIIQVLIFLVAALGLFDIWIDFRKLRPRIAASKNGNPTSGYLEKGD